jgi:F-type H+-transporting ATPase subunit alpha
MNVGISVSRVGGNAQIKAMKQVAGRLRLDLAQYRELEAFAGFGSELDKASQQQLARGARVVEVLKQPQFQPMPVEQQVMSIFAATGGYLDPFPVEDAKRFERDFLQYMETRHSDVGQHIREQGTLTEDVEGKLKSAVEEFARGFAPSDQGPGSEAAAGPGRRPDEMKRDVGWDRISAEGDEEPGRPGTDTDVQLPG